MPHRDDFDDDLMDPSSDAYDYKPVSSNEGGGGKAVKLLVAATVIAGLAGGAWYFVGTGVQNQDDVPLVRAMDSPTKEKPDDPGGMAVPNRDKTVYDRVAGDNTEPKLERLLPRAEQPLDKPVQSIPLPEMETPLTPSEDVAATDTIEQATPSETATPALPEVPSEDLAKNISEPAPAPVQIEDPNSPRALVKRGMDDVATLGDEQVDAPQNAPTQQDKEDLNAKIAEALGEEKPETQIEQPTTATAPKTAMAKVEEKPKTIPSEIKSLDQAGYILQLLSSKSESGVQSTWDKIKAKNTDIIGDLPVHIVKADLGPEKGIYYRLRLGPVQTADKAKSLCTQLKKRKVGCFIVKVR
ncbi:SPOR domain-containing protein [Terasakiella sp.]|uniref:SPOR domain-containing protein n=1 Tax=Terasakiella sp. TaxID=2034861 RepID=UPI003AA8C917